MVPLRRLDRLTLALIILMAGGASIALLRDRQAAHQLTHTTISHAWPELQRTTVALGPAELQRIDALLLGTRYQEGSIDLHFPYWYLVLQFGGGGRTELLLSYNFEMFEPGLRRFWINPPLKAHLERVVARIHDGLFGERLEWEQVDALFPRGGAARVTDLETGKSFQVRRRGGYLHTDIEPSTRRDTDTMKEIYGGRWSWLRRAVIVEVGGRRIAGSMNGMPHGGGQISSNDFPGHSCIHFYQSRVHKSHRVDPDHQLMVLKAAGLLASTLDTATPVELVTWLLVGLNSRDRVTYRYAVRKFQGEQWAALTGKLGRVQATHARLVRESGDRVTVEVDVTVEHRTGASRGLYQRKVPLEVVRSRPGGPWKVEPDSLLPLLESPADERAISPWAPNRPDFQPGLSRCGPT